MSEKKLEKLIEFLKSEDNDGKNNVIKILKLREKRTEGKKEKLYDRIKEAENEIADEEAEEIKERMKGILVVNEEVSEYETAEYRGDGEISLHDKVDDERMKEELKKLRAVLQK